MSKTKISSQKSMVDAYISVYEENGVKPVKTDAKIPEDFRNKNILYVINNNYMKGIMYSMIDIIRNIEDNYNIYLLMADKNTISIYKYKPEKKNVLKLIDGNIKRIFKVILKWYMKDDFTLYFESSNDYKSVYKRIIRDYNIDLIHIEHMAYHTIDLLEVAHDKGINTILSLHDLYYICPTQTIVNDKFMNYEENNPLIDEDKIKSTDLLTDVIYPNFKLFKPIWNRRWNKMFKYLSHIIVPTQATADIYTESYPEIKYKIDVIEHGYDIEIPHDVVLPEIKPDSPVRIVIPGNINTAKGIDYIIQLKKLDKDNKLELHFMGVNETEYDLNKYGKVHGSYKRGNFQDIIDSINPHFIGLFSILPETYSYTLTEAWSCGVPVIGLGRGAVGERIKDNSGGIIVSDNPLDAYHEILSVISNNDKYQTLGVEISAINVKDTKTMADEYLKIYDEEIRK